jgi:hypothetical protein
MARLEALEALDDLELSAMPCHDSCHAPATMPSSPQQFLQGFCTAELSRSLGQERRRCAAPLARRQRRAQPLKARAAHAVPHRETWQISTAHSLADRVALPAALSGPSQLASWQDATSLPHAPRIKLQTFAHGPGLTLTTWSTMT